MAGTTSDVGPWGLVPAWVIEAPIGDRAVRLYALLSRWADRESKSATALRSTIATALRCSPKSVDRAARELTALGAIEVRPRWSGDERLANEYHVLTVAPIPARGGVTADATQGRECPREPEPLEPEPLEPARAALTLVEQTDSARDQVEVDFATAWEHYPRKTARQAALRAYRARRREGVPASILEFAVLRYAADRRGHDQAFTMHGATFFGPDQRWRDFVAGAAAETSSDPDPPTGRPDYDAIEARAETGPRTGSRPRTVAPWEGDGG